MDKMKHWTNHFFLLLLHVSTSLEKTGSTDLYRLSSGNGGALSIYHGGKWGHICVKLFPDTGVAGSICERMGYLSRGDKIDVSLVDVGQITIDQFSCTSSSLDSCTLTPTEGNSKCPKVINNTASVITLTCTIPTNVHLIPEDSNVRKGIIETFRANKRGFFCRDSDDNAKKVADVVCKQMGYDGGIPLSDTNIPVRYSGKYFDVTCTGSESSLDACTVKERISSCTKVGRVECSLNTASQKTFDIRLSQFSKPATGSGTVEAYHYGRWGVICDTGWDINDAHVVCRQLGYREAVSAQTKAKFGQGTGLVFWNNVQCTGDELSLAECKHDVVLGTGSCNSVDAAGVVCSSEKLTRNQLSISDPSTVMTIPAGYSFLQSPGFPGYFTYQPYTTYTIVAPGLTAGTTIAAYVILKMFQGNQVEYLVFDNGRSTTALYGEDSFSGPFTSNPDTFKIIFNSSTSNGKGNFNIMLKASAQVELKWTKAVVTITSTTPASAGQSTGPGAVSVGMIGGIVGAIVGLAITAVIIIILHKKKKCLFKPKQRRSSVSFYEKAMGNLSGGRTVNPSFKPDEEGMKCNDIYESAGQLAPATRYVEVGIVRNVPRFNDVYAEVQPKSRRKREAKEPETGETKNDVIRSRPASGSAVKVVFSNHAYNEAPNGEGEHGGIPAPIPYEFEREAPGGEPSQARPNSNAYELEGTPGGFLPPLNSTAYAEFDILPKPAAQPPEEPGKKDKKKIKEKEKKGKKDKKKKKGNADEPKETPSSACPPSSKAPAVPKGDSTAVPRFDDANAVTYAEVGALGVGQPAGDPPQADSGQGEYDHLQFKRMNTPAQGGDDATYDVVNR